MAARILLLLLSLTWLCPGTSRAQTPPPAPALAVEISTGQGAPPTYGTIATGITSSSLFFNSSLHRLANVDPSVRQPSALKLEFKVDDGVVSIAAIALYGEFDSLNAPGSLEKLPHETLATYSGRLNDSITLSALARVGLQPFTIKIVTAQSDHPYIPATRSKAPSLQIDYAPLDRAFGTVTVHNLSTKAVNALQLGNTGELSTEGASRGGLKELIAPGGTYEMKFALGGSGRTVNGTYVEDPPPAALILQAALFADGSYEGDTQIAAGLASFDLGQAVQEQRIRGLVEPTLAQTQAGEQSGDEAKIKSILAAVDQLPTQPDPAMIAGLRARFPSLSDDGLAEAQPGFSTGMKEAVTTFEYEIKQFANVHSSHPQVPLATWWAGISQPR